MSGLGYEDLEQFCPHDLNQGANFWIPDFDSRNLRPYAAFESPTQGQPLEFKAELTPRSDGMNVDGRSGKTSVVALMTRTLQLH